jgi:UDP-glucose 4-epimerase
MSDVSVTGHTPSAHARRPVTLVAVLGSTGFVGAATTVKLASSGSEVQPVPAPRLRWRPGSTPADLYPDPAGYREVVDDLARALDGADVVVNAAGVADPAAPPGSDLFGANTLLPFLTARACSLAGVKRFIHVSSIAVQGDGVLDETARTAAFSPYSRSRALAERLLLDDSDLDRGGAVERVIFRPTSVHGPGRGITRSLTRLARSAVSCVAGDGSAPTPQVLVEDVAESISHLAAAPGPVPPIVLQPPSGMTTGLLLRLLGGREPRHLPARPTRAAVRCITACARPSLGAHAHARRLDMLLFGRRQVPGWLFEQGMAPSLRHEAWTELAEANATIAAP